jgi:hypothetical protein
VLNRLNGSVPGTLSRLDADYVPGDDTLMVKDAVPNINPGSLVSADGNTLYITKVAGGGTQFDVFAIVEGDTVTSGSIVRFKPVQTDAEIYARLSIEIESMSSPAAGLFAPTIVESEVDYVSNIYPVPDFWTVDPIRVLRVKAQHYEDDAWSDVNGWEWQPERGQVRVYGCPPNARKIQVIYALPFAKPTSMDDSMADLGVPESMQDIPILGACAFLSLGLEGRRLIPGSQPDVRRANEIPMTAGSSLAREWTRAKQQRIDEEQSRLMRLYGPRYQDLTNV